MNQLNFPYTNLDLTLMGGQAFNWIKEPNRYVGYMVDQIVVISNLDKNGNATWQVYTKNNQLQNNLQTRHKSFKSKSILLYPENLISNKPGNEDDISQDNNADFINKYFRLDVDFGDIVDQISKDIHVKTALQQNHQPRLLKQDFDQTLISYLCSARKNIKSIRNSIYKMSKELGEKVKIDGQEYFYFPKTEIIANTSENKLKEFGLGFRAKYVRDASKHLCEGKLRSEITKLEYPKAKEELKKINGVGDKIADCVLLYSLGHDHIMPLDVWGKRILIVLYGLDPKLSYQQMSQWFTNRFGKYSGWAGQILFEWVRGRKKLR